MKRARILLIVAALLCVVTAGVAEAAAPSSGTLSKRTRVVKWSGTFTLSEPVLTGGCLGGETDPICDHFLLKVNLGDGARIRVELPAPNAMTDLDLHVYSADGAEVASSGNLIGENEIAEFTHRGRMRNKPYEVQITPWAVVPGTTYKATAKVK